VTHFQSEKEELGPGADQQSQPELGAKDDTGEQPKDNKQEKKDKENKETASEPQPECLDEVCCKLALSTRLE
jgi:hypothetical protein